MSVSRSLTAEQHAATLDAILAVIGDNAARSFVQEYIAALLARTEELTRKLNEQGAGYPSGIAWRHNPEAGDDAYLLDVHRDGWDIEVEVGEDTLFYAARHKALAGSSPAAEAETPWGDTHPESPDDPRPWTSEAETGSQFPRPQMQEIGRPGIVPGPLAGSCAKSKRKDGKHGWSFDGDDPRVVCSFCGQMRDALSGRLIGAAGVSDSSEAEKPEAGATASQSQSVDADVSALAVHRRVGEYEERHDLPPIRKQYRDSSRGVVVEYLTPMLDRRVYETWVEDGEKWGRWNWESGIGGRAAADGTPDA